MLSPVENDDFLREQYWGEEDEQVEVVCICADYIGKTGAIAVMFCDAHQDYTDNIAEQRMDARNLERGVSPWQPGITTADMYAMEDCPF